jgi:group I intron endonuclease
MRIGRKPIIYRILVLGGSKSYIGSTNYFASRKGEHLHLLRRGRHHCRALQNSFNKYGEQSFIWVILEEVEDASGLLQREQFWLDHMAGRLYNRSKTAGSYSRLGCKMTKEARAKISASLIGNQYRKGIPHPEDIRAKISKSLKAAYASGKKLRLNGLTDNCKRYWDKVRAGEIRHPTRRSHEQIEDVLHSIYANAGDLQKAVSELEMGVEGAREILALARQALEDLGFKRLKAHSRRVVIDPDWIDQAAEEVTCIFG